MNRRGFITLLGGAAVWPLAALAQQPERMRRIGVLLTAAADDPDFQAWVGAFMQALAQSGWIIGRNVRIDTRWAGANSADIRRHAAELVALAPDVILAHGAGAVGPLMQATRTVPIAFPVIADPVAAAGLGEDAAALVGVAGRHRPVGVDEQVGDRGRRQQGGRPAAEEHRAYFLRACAEYLAGQPDFIDGQAGIAIP